MTDDDSGPRRRYAYPSKLQVSTGGTCDCRARGVGARHVTSFLARSKGAFDAVFGSERVFVGLARREPVSHGVAAPPDDGAAPDDRPRRDEFPLHLLRGVELETSRKGNSDPRLVVRLGLDLTWTRDEDGDVPRLVLVAGPRDPQQPRGSKPERQIELRDVDVKLEPSPDGPGCDLVLSPPRDDARRFAQVALGRVARGGCVVSVRLPAASVAFVAADRGYRISDARLCQLPAPVQGLAFAHLSYVSPPPVEDGDEDEGASEVSPLQPLTPADALRRFDAMCTRLLSVQERELFTAARCPEVRRQELRAAAEQRLVALMDWLAPQLGLGTEARGRHPGPITAVVEERAEALLNARLAELERLRAECDL